MKTLDTGEGGADEIPMTFPQRLMDILSNDQVNDVVTWLPHGKAFIIYKKKKFAAEILPKFFKQSKFTSFTRKLNRWGFTRVTRGPETGSYFHKYFLRDQPRLCMQMSCQNARLQNDQQFPAMGQQHQHQPMIGGIPGMPGMSGMPGMPGMPGMQDMQFGAGMMANPALLQMQRQLQLEQQMQQQQQLQTELLRRAMASQASSGSTQAHLMGGGGVGKKEDMLYMQMLAQSKASSMSAQPLMRAIQSSLLTNQGPMHQPVPPPEPERAVRRASAA